MLIIRAVTFFKAIVIKVDLFGSEIIDEKHFPTLEEANRFTDCVMSNNSNIVCAVCRM